MFGMFERKLHFTAIAIALCATLSICALSLPAAFAQSADKPISLKVVSAWAQNNKMNDALWMLQKKVKEKTNGKVDLVWGGGPEAIPAFQLVEALRNNVVDVAWTAHTYNVAQLPVVEGAKLSKLTPGEERERGVAAFYEDIYQKKLNAQYLGKGTPGLTYNLYTTVPIKGIADFQGMSIRVTPAYKAFVEALKASPVSTDPGEVFTALERNMVRGYGWPSLGIADFGWDEVTKFAIEPPFYQVDVIALAHVNSWKKLPKDLQESFMQAVKEVEQESYDHFKKLINEDREKLKKRGVQEIKLTDEEAKKYLDLAYEASWKEVAKKDPEQAQKLKELLSK